MEETQILCSLEEITPLELRIVKDKKEVSLCYYETQQPNNLAIYMSKTQFIMISVFTKNIFKAEIKVDDELKP